MCNVPSSLEVFTLARSGLVRGHVIGIIVIIVIILWTGGAALYDGHTKEHCHCHHAVSLLTGTMCHYMCPTLTMCSVHLQLTGNGVPRSLADLGSPPTHIMYPSLLYTLMFVNFYNEVLLR